MARGSARVMGFNIPLNFNWPYLAVSPRDFWQRWHISLSSWIRDYLYLPLMGSRPQSQGVVSGGIGAAEPPARATAARRNFALVGTWFIMGLWHGANWTFAIWGLWHAVLVLGHRMTGRIRETLPAAVRASVGWVLTMAMAMLGWIYFRAASVTDANFLLLRAFDLSKLRTMSLRENQYIIVFLIFVGMLAVGVILRFQDRLRIPAWLRLGVLASASAVMIFSSILMLREVRQFIYFQF